MGLLDFLKPISKWKPARVKDFLRLEQPDSYTLLDVRQPGEYEKMHLPGAKLVPVGELPERLGELDPSKPVVVY